MTTTFQFKQSLASLSSLEPAHALFHHCTNTDGFAAKIYWNTLLERQHDLNALDYLCFTRDNNNNTRLIGLLNIFFFSNAPEICILVDPNFRHQGIFKKFLQIALMKLKNYVVSEYMLIINEKFEKFLDYAKHHQGKFDHREVEMRPTLTISQYYNNLNNKAPLKKLIINQASIDNLDILADIHVQSFENPTFKAMKERFTVTLREPHRKAYLAQNEDGEIIGKLHAREDFNRIVIHDVGIAKAFRRKGYGRALMLTWMEHYANQYTKPIAVEVLGDNVAALELYKSCGFELTNAYQFWRFAL